MSGENQSDTDAPVTPKCVQWRTCVAEWHTFDAMALPARRLSQVSRRPPSGNRSQGTTSRLPSDPSSERQAQKLGSPRQTSAHDHYEQAGPWISSWHGWTETPSAKWGGGGVIQCSATSTEQQRVSPKASQKRCSNMAHTRSFFCITPTTSAKRHSRALKAPFTRVSGGLVQYQCGLININIAFLAHS